MPIEIPKINTSFGIQRRFLPARRREQGRCAISISVRSTPKSHSWSLSFEKDVTAWRGCSRTAPNDPPRSAVAVARVICQK
jgi:hypothetical protein